MISPHQTTARMFCYVRQSQKMSLRVFAARLRVAHTTLYYIESGDKAPSMELLQRLVAVSGFESRQALIQTVFSSHWASRQIHSKRKPKLKKRRKRI